MTWVVRGLVPLVVPALLSAQATAPATARPPSTAFPHAQHARLFTLCSSCHVGITIGDSFRSFPSPNLCAQCHDGVIQPAVRWQAPERKGPRLLVFSHPQHLSASKVSACASCHGVDGATKWMNVARAVPEPCVSCHTHGRSAHLADATPCATCHRVLTAATALSDADVAGLPKPPSHARADFISSHGPAALATGANCATCHARESCLRCHVDGSRISVIQALGTDARVARLVAGRPAVYPMPADHRSAHFEVLHGAAARANVERCATCHTRTSCESCHTGEGARAVLARMPAARDATAPGVQLRHVRTVGPPDLSLISTSVRLPMQALQAPPLRHDTTQRVVRVHAPGFARAHGAQAASGAASCTSCHAQRFCTDCHAGERVTRRYHVANFVSTHAPQAYRRETDCSSCHSTEAFCRECHRQTGLASSTNARSAVFHNAEPLWLLQHGRAARQDLTSCASCHQQTYCMQCHSDLGLKVSPHGPGFDAARMSSRNPRLCLTCHFKNPLQP